MRWQRRPRVLLKQSAEMAWARRAAACSPARADCPTPLPAPGLQDCPVLPCPPPSYAVFNMRWDYQIQVRSGRLGAQGVRTTEGGAAAAPRTP